jgi:hypothetical protein
MSQEINKTIKRLFKAFKEKIQGKPLSVRSSRWETVRKHFSINLSIMRLRVYKCEKAGFSACLFFELPI